MDIGTAKPGNRVLDRRKFLLGAGAIAAGAVAGKLFADHDEAGRRADVFIARVSSYEGASRIVDALRGGLGELGIGRDRVRGRSVLLKPNLVEPSAEAPHINTHPAMILAAAEVFRSLGAREVLVAEGPGHVRDVDLVLEQSGLDRVLREGRLPFQDLNHDEVFDVPNRLGVAGWRRLYLPEAVRRADIVVSMPKLKTHHWAGVTLAMKNLFGVMPGVVYGWPKNVLHVQGIENSILDINAAVRPHLAIVDGVVGMEGDGPIMGTPRSSGLVVLGSNLPAVDATAARLMGIDPRHVGHLAEASGRLGAIDERHIRQRGESIASLRQDYELPPTPAASGLRA